MPETPAITLGSRPDIERCTGHNIQGNLTNTRDATNTAHTEILKNVTVRIVSEENKLDVDTQESRRHLRKPSEMHANRKLFQERCSKEMTNKVRKQEIIVTKKQEELKEKKSHKIQERDARKFQEEPPKVKMKMQETCPRTWNDASPGPARI